MPFAHLVADHHEDGGEHGERDEPRQRRGEEEDGEQGERVDNAGDGRFCAGADVGGGAGDGPGGGESAKERREDIGDTLRDQFHSGIVAVAAHAVGDDGAHQGLDGSEHGDGDGGREQGVHQGITEHRHAEAGKT